MPERGGGIVGRILQEVEARSGTTLVSNDRLAYLQEADRDLRSTWRDLDLLGYTALDYLNGNPKELRAESRRAMSQKVLVAWMQDPQLARAVTMLNDFTFGRGVPQPRAKDKKVQEILDEFWNDRDNKILLTSHEGQVAMGTDLSIQSNLFLLIFDDGRDGKVKVGLLNHDAVEDVVRDPANRLRILYYVARERRQKYDYGTGRYVTEREDLARPKLTYYEHYANVKSLDDDGVDFEKAPAEKIGDGLVYHLAVNRTTEMAFGVPEMQRVLRWATAYNDFMAARVDMVKAAAAFVMKRKIKGTPNQLAKMATRAISRQSPLAGVDDPAYATAGRAAGILNENELVSHEAMRLDTGAGQAQQDGTMIHGQIAAGVGLPQHYLGNSDATLATATAMELFVLKMVESRQEVFENLYRTLFEKVIQKAIDDGRLDETADPADTANIERQEVIAANVEAMADRLISLGLVEADEREQATKVLTATAEVLREGIEDQAQQERDTKRDLTFDFSMPSPLRRMMSDLITSIQGIAQTFDPNNTNVELSRALLAIALGEALEVDDPAGLVEKILPPGYVDPMIALAQQQQDQAAQAAQGGGNIFGPNASGPVPGGGADESAGGAGQGYGAPMRSTPPEAVRGAQEGRVLAVRGRDGQTIWRLQEQQIRPARPDEDEALVTQIRGRSVGLDALFDSEVGHVVMAELDALTIGGSNGNGNHPEED